MSSNKIEKQVNKFGGRDCCVYSKEEFNDSTMNWIESRSKVICMLFTSQ